jgi:uncharacterized Zn finger protein
MPPENSKPASPESSCSHKRTRVIAEDENAKYVECLDCGAILEAGEVKAGDAQSETLGDA